MQNMVSVILLIPLIVPSSTQTRPTDPTLKTLAFQISAAVVEIGHIRDAIEGIKDVIQDGSPAQPDLLTAQIIEIIAVVGATQNATSQLLTELDTLKGRQAVSAAVQASQVFLFVVYLLTIISWGLVKRCQKVREEKAREEFELLERKLQSSKARRRAKEKSAKEAPVPSQK